MKRYISGEISLGRFIAYLLKIFGGWLMTMLAHVWEGQEAEIGQEIGLS